MPTGAVMMHGGQAVDYSPPQPLLSQPAQGHLKNTADCSRERQTDVVETACTTTTGAAKKTFVVELGVLPLLRIHSMPSSGHLYARTRVEPAPPRSYKTTYFSRCSVLRFHGSARSRGGQSGGYANYWRCDRVFLHSWCVWFRFCFHFRIHFSGAASSADAVIVLLVLCDAWRLKEVTII